MMADLAESTDPALVDVRKYYGFAPQDDEKFPTELPLLVLSRMTAEYLTTFCGTMQDCCFVTVQVLHVARDADSCREQAIATRVLFADLQAMDLEGEDYEPDIRGFAITQTYRVFDESPGVTPAP